MYHRIPIRFRTAFYCACMCATIPLCMYKTILFFVKMEVKVIICIDFISLVEVESWIR